MEAVIGRLSAVLKPAYSIPAAHVQAPTELEAPGAGPGVECNLAAVLATDMIDYGRCVETNEGETLGRLSDLREELIEPVIARHRGEMLKRTGDGAHIRFDSALDTVRCVVEVQRAKLMTISDSSRLMQRASPRKD